MGHRCTQGGRRGIKVYPTSKFFAKLVNKNAIKYQKGVSSSQNFHNPYIPSLPKFGKNLMDPPSGFSNRVHLGPSREIQPLHKWHIKLNYCRFILISSTTISFSTDVLFKTKPVRALLAAKKQTKRLAELKQLNWVWLVSIDINRALLHFQERNETNINLR